jgi:hypothetical protein
MVVQHQCCGCGSAGSAAATTGAGCTTTPTGARHAAAPCSIAKSSAMCGPRALGMPYVRVAAFDRVGFACVAYGGVRGVTTIHEGLLAEEPITGVGSGVGRMVDHPVQRRERACGHDRPTHARVRGAIHRRYAIDTLFVSPTHVSRASSSTVSTGAGCGGTLGSRSAAAVTQLSTLWCCIPHCRAIRRKCMPSTYPFRAWVRRAGS